MVGLHTVNVSIKVRFLGLELSLLVESKASAVVSPMWDKLTEYLSKEACKDRQLYRIRSRNLDLGVYRAESGGFLGIRTKFGRRYVFEEYHWDNGEPYGTVKPIADLGETLPDAIPNEESLGTFCDRCDKKVAYVRWPEGGEREITLQSGGKMMVAGQWQHMEPTDCTDPRSYGKGNVELFRWLEQMEAKHAECSVPPGGAHD